MIYQELMLVVRVSHLFVTSFEMSGGGGGGGVQASTDLLAIKLR